MFSEKKFIERLLFTGLIAILVLTAIFSLSIVDNLPFLKIKTLQIISNNKKLAALAKKVIKKETENNLLFLKVKSNEIIDELRKQSDFQIENLKIIRIDFLKRKAVISLKLNKPLITFNKNLCLAENGRIFRTKTCTKSYLLDKTSLWREGEIYNLTPIVKQLVDHFAVKNIVINEFSIKIRGNNFFVYLPKKRIDLSAINGINSQIRQTFNLKNSLVYLNLEGKKANYIKIIKERANE